VAAAAAVAAGRVDAVRVRRAAVQAGRTLVHLGAVELIHPTVARQALAQVRAHGVHAPGVGMAVMAVQASKRQALVHI